MSSNMYIVQISLSVLVLAGCAQSAVQGETKLTVAPQAKAFQLAPMSPILLEGKAGHFDYMEVDVMKDRLLAAHSGAGELVVFDLKTETVLANVPVGRVQGVALDDKDKTYILGDSAEKQVVFVDSESLTKTGAVKVKGPVDAVAFDSKNGLAYADEDDGSHVWVIDVRARKLVKTISLPGVPEFVVYDPGSDRIYQNIKDKDQVIVINPRTNKVETAWSTLPATGPHGLAVDSKSGQIFSAGHNGKLVAINVRSGKVVSEADIAPGTDQISFDPRARVVACASKGFISLVHATETGLEAEQPTSSHAGSHTIAVDSSRGSVWVSYADDTKSFLQKFTSRP